MSGDLSSFESSLLEMFRRLGMPDPLIMARISREWDELAGEPWVGRSRPLVIEGKTLVVEANTPSLVAFLRYGSAALVAALSEALGAGHIDSIEVKSPPRR